jgi:hypothetical protein
MNLSQNFNEEFFMDQARWLAELSHSNVNTKITCLGNGSEWNVVYRFELCLITLRFRVMENGLLEWEHFRVCPRNHGIGRKFAGIFLEEIKLIGVKRVILEPKNHDVAQFWKKIGFRPLTFTLEDKLPSESSPSSEEKWFIDL